jgi:hypothetical protein
MKYSLFALCQNFGRKNLKKRNRLEEMRGNIKVDLKWCGSVWNEFIWFMLETSEGLSERGNEPACTMN